MTCEHFGFITDLRFDRITKREGGPVVGYSVDIRINCADCGEVFAFMGLPGGCLPDKPTSSIDGLEARMPIRPVGDDIRVRSAEYRLHDTTLTPSEVEQLKALQKHSTTRPGDLISKTAEKGLREKGLTGRSEDGEWCMVDKAGVEWLRQAGLIPQVDPDYQKPPWNKQEDP